MPCRAVRCSGPRLEKRETWGTPDLDEVNETNTVLY